MQEFFNALLPHMEEIIVLIVLYAFRNIPDRYLTASAKKDLDGVVERSIRYAYARITKNTSKPDPAFARDILIDIAAIYLNKNSSGLLKTLKASEEGIRERIDADTDKVIGKILAETPEPIQNLFK